MGGIILEPPKLKGTITPVLKERTNTEPTLSELIQDAESAKNNSEFKIAQELYKICLRFEENNRFLIQRLALVTYKSRSPNPKQALMNAAKILEPLNPEETTDIETLGLSGAINKRLFEETGEIDYLKSSIKFYEKGFYIKDDYYNGINLAYQFNVLSKHTADPKIADSYFIQARIVREKVIEICTQLIEHKDFNLREDRHWIYQSLAQAYLGLGEKGKIKEIEPKILEYSEGQFDMDTFLEQNKKLIELTI